jgi:Kef-type K+ transport system membrane component KefB
MRIEPIEEPADAPGPTPNRLKVFVFYTLMIGGTIVLFLLIRSRGELLKAPLATGLDVSRTGAASLDTLLHVLLALAVIIITARVVGILFGYLQQPAVIGEVVGGILLGPSLLGRLSPELSTMLLPSATAPFLGVIAQLGVILYMFLVGLELDLRVVAKSGHATLAISHASIIVPFLLGSVLALVLYPLLSTNTVPFTVFALFLGVSLSVTAFPVLARILTDKRLHRTRMGALALTCAAVDDATAWCLLAFVVSIAQAQAMAAVRTLLLTVSFVALVLGVVAPLVRRYLLPYLERTERLTRSGLTIIFVAMLVSALATELIGIHAIFGAFLLGAIIPSGTRVATELTNRLEDVVSVLLLPAFFAFTGLRTQIGLLSSSSDWLICAAIIAVACVGKFGGSLVASRLAGLKWRDSAALGVLMNTRGLVELIVLNIGLDLRVISPSLFAMLVIMALVTTFMTTPILHLLIRHHPWMDLTSEKTTRLGYGLADSIR